MFWRTKFRSLCGLLDAMLDPLLFGKVFADESFWTWRVVAKLIDGIELTEPRELALFEECTGRSYNRQARRAAVRDLTLLVGMRGGKDRFESAVAMWRAALQANWKKHISAGERATVLLIGRDKSQARILRGYCDGLLEASPELAKRVLRTTNDLIEFRNAGTIEIVANDAASLRGRSNVAVLASEVSHWSTSEHSASPDEEVISAASHGMAMCPDPDGGLLICGSSVHRKRGFMFNQYRELWGNADADGVCWFAPSQIMNPALPQSVIHAAMTKNLARANADFLNIWRDDAGTNFMLLDEIEACIDAGVHERPRVPGVHYVAHIDAGPGIEASFALAIAHRIVGSNIAVLDLLRERKPPFRPLEVVGEYAQVLKAYGIHEVFCDAHAFEPFADEWRRHGVTAKKSDNKTVENYLIARPLIQSNRFRFLDDKTLKNQLLNLEHGFTLHGHESILPPHGGHDDVAAAAIGSLVAASRGPTYDRGYFGWSPEADTPSRPPKQLAPITNRSYAGYWHESLPGPTTRTPSADENLRSLYKALDTAIKAGGSF